MVSVIIPTYNSIEYLRDTLLSVYSQTYTDYEVLVVDDGSTDNTGDIILYEFPHVRYFCIVHGGVSKARNYGITHSLGEYVAFLDADDIWLPTKLEKQIQVMESNPEIMMIFTENYVFDNDGIKSLKHNKRNNLLAGDIVQNIFNYSHVGTPTVMVRREVFDVVGLFEESISAAEDDNMWMRIAARYQIELLDEPLVKVRLTSGSLSRNPINLFKGVIDHIDLLKLKYNNVYTMIDKNIIDKKRASAYFDIGYYYFNFYNRKECIRCMIQSLKYKYSLKTIIYVLATLLPTSILKKIRKIKQSTF